MMHTIEAVALPLLFCWLLVGGAFWLLGLLPIPRPAALAASLDRWGGFELQPERSRAFRELLWISAVGLFLELLLVRWVSSEIRIFAYFKNLVLVACFFGFGLGCYLSRRRVQLLHTLVPLLALVLLLEVPWHGLTRFLLDLSEYIGGLADVHVFGRHYAGGPRLYIGGLIAFSVVIPLAGLVTLAMVPMGQMVARYLETARNGIVAYSANVAASLVGIWLFTGICFVSAPPIVWFAMVGAALVWFAWPKPTLRNATAAVFLMICGLFYLGSRESNYRPERWYETSDALRALRIESVRTFWSPYQKLTLSSLTDGKQTVRYVLNTNGSWYQDIMILRPDFVAQHPEYYAELKSTSLPFHRYNMPYRFKPEPESVLILGAGMGNDVAAALRNGARRVVAVEIDPLIIQQGKEHNLEKAYQDPRVVPVVDDARSYVQNTDEHFDLIVSSILDSQTTQSSFTNIRTDNYVYTREGIEHMLRLLKPGGVLSLSFSSERPWFAGRLRDLLTGINGHPPVIVFNGNNFFLVGDGLEQRIDQNPELRAFVAAHPIDRFEDAAPTTDDWPYFYQQRRSIPLIVVLFSVVLVGLCWIVLRGMGLSVRTLAWHFFWLGAGFMLMEVQIISKMALLFGTTWLVNSIVITALLVLILLANSIVSRWPGAAWKMAYPGLFLSLALCWWVPVQSLLVRGWAERAIFGTLFLCLPVFFAGLIFTTSFARHRFQAEAFGANLFGSVIGGLLEAMSYQTGIRSLVLLAAGCYFLSLLALRRTKEQVAAATVAGMTVAGD
jgi:spermidine synthase